MKPKITTAALTVFVQAKTNQLIATAQFPHGPKKHDYIGILFNSA